jgi:NAD-dependent DNA ligase
MQLLKHYKKDLFLNADKYWKEHQKDYIRVAGFELKIGSRLRGVVTTNGKVKKFYLVVLSLNPQIIAYWIQDEYAIYLAPVDFEKLLVKRDIDKRTMKSANLHPQNFRTFTAKSLNMSEVRTLLWNLPRLQSADVKAQPNALVLTTPKLIHDFAHYATAGKEDIVAWLFGLALASKDAYHTGSKESEITDNQYDDLVEFLKTLDSKRAAILDAVGAPVAKNIRSKVQLDYDMGSLNKIKPDGVATAKFVKETKDKFYVLSDKLDGLSLSLKYVDGTFVRATTRGDGSIGQDVTRHIKNVPTVPKKIGAKFKGEYTFRAEGILSQADFESVKAYGDKEYANGRNLLAGMINRNEPNVKVLSKINVIAYSIMSHEDRLDKKEQLELIKESGLHVVHYSVLKSTEVNEDHLTSYINERKKVGGFELDGAVIEANSCKIRVAMGNASNTIKPDYAKAFKTGETEAVEAHVQEVVWAVSKHGKLKPRIKISPVKLSGVTVTFATAFNAAFVYDNKLGPGAKVLLTRSGDVIPHILKTLVKANKAQMPDKKVFGEYAWNETEVDLVLVNASEDETVKIKQMASFFSKIGVDYLGRGLIERFYHAGIDTIDKLINTSIPELMSIDGIQKRNAEKIYNGIITALNGIELPTLASATPFFGEIIAGTRLRKIYEVRGEEMFDWAGFTVGEVAQQISQISGFSLDTGKQFAQGIKPFKAFLKRNAGRVHIKAVQKKERKSSKLDGVSFVWTGVRQHDAEAVIEANGGQVWSAVKAGLTYLVAKDPGSGSSKMVKAQSLGVKVIGPNEVLALLKSKGLL